MPAEAQAHGEALRRMPEAVRRRQVQLFIRGALREILGEDRAGEIGRQRIFDLGLGSPYLRFCIRSGDPELLAVLRSALGSSLLDPGNPATQAILRISPHRVVLSGLGRVEVYQAIPAADAGEESPLGPHTHLLPERLSANRTHRETLPIPSGWIPALMLYPPCDPR